MGTPGFGAIAVMLTYVPINVIVTRIVRFLQVKQMEWKDRRVNFTKEVYQIVFVFIELGGYWIESSQGFCLGKSI